MNDAPKITHHCAHCKRQAQTHPKEPEPFYITKAKLRAQLRSSCDRGEQCDLKVQPRAV